MKNMNARVGMSDEQHNLSRGNINEEVMDERKAERQKAQSRHSALNEISKNNARGRQRTLQSSG